VHCDPAQPDGRHVKEAVHLWTTLSGSAQIVTEGIVTIPQYRNATHPDGALTPGSSGQYDNGHSWYDVVTARSAIGLSKDARTLTLFTWTRRASSDNPDGRAVGSSLAVFANVK
jgi:hypothetical protein